MEQMQQVKAVRQPLPQHLGPRPLLQDGVLKCRWWFKQKIWIGVHSVTQIEHSEVLLYVPFAIRQVVKCSVVRKKGVVMQRERRRVGASWGDTKAGVARVTDIRPTQRSPGPSQIFLVFIFHTKRTTPTPPPHLVESSKQQVTEKYLTHSSADRSGSLDFFNIVSRSFFTPPSRPFPPPPFFLGHSTTNKGTSTVPPKVAASLQPPTELHLVSSSLGLVALLIILLQ